MLEIKLPNNDVIDLIISSGSSCEHTALNAANELIDRYIKNVIKNEYVLQNRTIIQYDYQPKTKTYDLPIRTKFMLDGRWDIFARAFQVLEYHLFKTIEENNGYVFFCIIPYCLPDSICYKLIVLV